MLKKVLVIFLIICLEVSTISYGFYNYEKRFYIFKLNRNINPVNYNISYSDDSFTNNDINVKIEFDKIIDIIDKNNDLNLSEDGKTITKTVVSNENKKFLIRDEDFNYKEIEYNINWIDKESPTILGVENEGVYNNDVHLEYSDNTQIKEIYSDYYSNSFDIYTNNQNFEETNNLQIVPATRNSITIYVINNKKEMEKYNYYMDGVLYATTHNKQYTFSGVELSNNNHHFKVEALDRYGNILEYKECNAKTLPIDRIEFALSKSTGIKYIALKGVPESVSNVSVNSWVDGFYNETYYSPPISNDSTNSYVTAIVKNNYSGKYIINFEITYIENGISKKFNVLGSVFMPNNYAKADYEGLPNEFKENGNYYVRCTDIAGNESEVEFIIRK